MISNENLTKVIEVQTLNNKVWNSFVWICYVCLAINCFSAWFSFDSIKKYLFIAKKYLSVCFVCSSEECICWGIMRFERQVFNQCHTVHIVEYTHQGLWKWKSIVVHCIINKKHRTKRIEIPKRNFVDFFKRKVIHHSFF